MIDRQTDTTNSGTTTDDWRLTLAPYCSRISTTSVWPARDAMCRLELPFFSTHTHTHRPHEYSAFQNKHLTNYL